MQPLPGIAGEEAAGYGANLPPVLADDAAAGKRQSNDRDGGVLPLQPVLGLAAVKPGHLYKKRHSPAQIVFQIPVFARAGIQMRNSHGRYASLLKKNIAFSNFCVAKCGFCSAVRML